MRLFAFVLLSAAMSACNPASKSDDDTAEADADTDTDTDSDTDSDTDTDTDTDTDSGGETDADDDGYTVADGDCNDADAAISPAAAEVCDGVDNNCDAEIDEGVTTVWYADGDGDGAGDAGTSVSACDAPAGHVDNADDCDDTSALFYPGAPEEDCTDPSDYNCDGSVGFADADADGWAACVDCDDASPSVNPDALEACNTVDDDCDGTIDEADAVDAPAWYLDADADGYGDDASATVACDMPAGHAALGGDCDDADGAFNPGALEEDCTDPSDYNCDGSVGYADADADGWAACADCDDTDALVNPDGTEVCNDLDDDCDGDVDSGATDAPTWYADADSDGYGDATLAQTVCDAPAGYVADATDCDDAAALYNPGADESDCADPNDYNCDGSVAYLDGDADGWAACEDCDDASFAVNPDAEEACNTIDDDCDGVVDESDAIDVSTWFRDADGDGYGDAADSLGACGAPAGYVANADDCDDTAALAYPDAVETCDGTDEDCDGDVDEPDALDASEWYADADVDGYGDAAVASVACYAPAGSVADATDCDDADDSVYPGADEYCDGADDDCDGSIDEGALDELVVYADADADGYGDPATVRAACALSAGWQLNADDCNDAAADDYPGATELCDERDNDCDGETDEGAIGGVNWYADADEDGYGDPADVEVSCVGPEMFVRNDDDCDDTDTAISPAAAEVCGNGIDENCSDTDDCRDDTVLDASTHAAYVWTGVNGSTSTSSFGSKLVGGADFDGDGYADLAVGDRLYDASSSLSNMGRVTILQGTGAGFTDTVADPAVTITGGDSAGRFGQGLAAGDLDGDGIDDLIVGTPAINGYGAGSSALTDNGKAAVFLSPLDRSGSSTNALSSTTSGVADCQVEGAAARSYLGTSVAFGGDLTGDGNADWVYGAYQSYSSGTTNGYVGIVSSSTCSAMVSSNAAIHTITGTASGDYFGLTVLGDLDLDGDGEDDLLVVAGGADSVYAFLGPVTATTAADADAVVTGVDFYTTTSSPEDNASDRLGAVGDTDGDGYAEFLLGSNSYDVGASTTAGAAFLLSGDAMVVAGTETAANLADFAVYGGSTTFNVGAGVSGAGDVDGDGAQDFLVGFGADTVSGTAYAAAALFYGGATGSYSPSLSATPDGYAMYNLEATTTSAGGSGGAVAPLGDIDGDGFDDFALANMNYGATRVGRVYAVLGSGE